MNFATINLGVVFTIDATLLIFEPCFREDVKSYYTYMQPIDFLKHFR